MIQISEIPALLEQLEDHIADDLEGQELEVSGRQEREGQEGIKRRGTGVGEGVARALPRSWRRFLFIGRT